MLRMQLGSTKKSETAFKATPPEGRDETESITHDKSWEKKVKPKSNKPPNGLKSQSPHRNYKAENTQFQVDALGGSLRFSSLPHSSTRRTWRRFTCASALDRDS